MTVNQLTREVAGLGFENEVEYTEALSFAIKRGLSQLYTDLPDYGEYRFYQGRIAPARTVDSLLYRSDESAVLSGKGRAISFSSFGAGAYRISDDSGNREFFFSEGISTHRHFIYGSFTLTLFGETCFDLYGIGIFDNVYSKNEEDIPLFGQKASYSMSKLLSDFSAFEGEITDDGKERIKDAECCGDALLLPIGYSGSVRVGYRKRPPVIPVDPDAEFILPEGYGELLALITSAYVWLDDSPEKAELYFALYRDGVAKQRSARVRLTHRDYRDVLRWA